MAVTFLFRPIAQTRDGYRGAGLNSSMNDSFDDLTEFLERRLADRWDRGDPSEQEILDALIAWIEAGRPAPSISVTYGRLDNVGSVMACRQHPLKIRLSSVYNVHKYGVDGICPYKTR